MPNLRVKMIEKHGVIPFEKELNDVIKAIEEKDYKVIDIKTNITYSSANQDHSINGLIYNALIMYTKA